MAALVHYGVEPGQVELREVPTPSVRDGEVLLRVGAVGVCGSDIHQLHGSQSWAVDVPVTLGHEFTGVVTAVGEGVSGFKEGDRVVSETAAFICGECIYCRTGHYNVCPHRRGFGARLDGAMAEYVRVPARCLHHIPDSLPFSLAALTEPCCVAYNAVAERATVKPGNSVLVLGPGPIGLLCLLVARLQGAEPTIVAGLSADSPRLELARRLGATHTVDLQAQDLQAFLAYLGDGFGVDVVVDATGAAPAFETAMAAVRPLGQIVKVGWGPGPLGVSLDPIVQKAVTVHGSFSHTYPTWERVIALLASGHLDVAPLIGLDTDLPRWKEAFDGMQSGRFAKAVLRP
ncbi:MAG: Galactitol-1-phosphate 5-dehydrogenase [uncultured Chloroflexia bacterium]|uniref:Galactitol-1-phosphate 5-dehydrogenase n=1 Tax=uncultured Chloroflexia bacterium TaxID=1672391 RepID=A0A6J4J6M6_9CHLR|nr:MAG: Galactitol-1-phosphate 5-dehydrogenase [uncultured Chloroflexia bacterium]